MEEESFIIKSLNKKENIQDKKSMGKSNNKKDLGKKPGKEKDLGKKADKGKSKIKVCGQQSNYGNASTNNTTLHKDIEEKQIQEMNKICIKKDAEKTDEIFTI